MPPYRADFVAQGWLVIEIDGAEWHSSAEAIERDRERDEVMQKRGLRVLRLPAKLVFRTPDEAISRMQAALKDGRPKVEPRAETIVKQAPVSGLAKVGLVLQELNAGTQRMRAIQQAMSKPEATFAIEKQFIDSSIDSAKRAIHIAEYIGGDPAKQAVFDDFHERIPERSKILDKNQRGLSLARHTERVVVVPSLTAPEKHEAEEINSAIQHAYHHLLAERSKYMSAQRERLRNEPRLCEMAKKHFGKLGCPEVWDLVAPSSPSRHTDGA